MDLIALRPLQGTEGRKYRSPDTHSANHLSNVEISLQDPTGRASGLTILDGLLGDLAITMSLGSQIGDEPVDTCDDGYAEADHPGSKNGWARLSDSLPARSAGDLPWPAVINRQCRPSLCYRGKIYFLFLKRSLTYGAITL